MSRTLEQYEEEIDGALCSIFDAFDVDDFMVQMIIEYCHNHKKEIASFVKYR